MLVVTYNAENKEETVRRGAWSAARVVPGILRPKWAAKLGS